MLGLVDIKPDNLPTVICPTCGERMRLVGVEWDDTRDGEVHILTFECSKGHLATTTFPQ